MKLAIHLIPIPPPDTPDTGQPSPANHLFHYTTGDKLRLILLSSHIKPSTAGIEPH